MKPDHASGLESQRTRILEAAARTMAEHGYHGMSMRGLARATGKSLATAYNYFSSKEEILFALQQEAFERLIGAAEKALAGVERPSSRLYVLILNHVSYFSAHADVMRVLVHEAGSLPPARRRAIRALKNRYFELGREVVADLLEEGCGEVGVSGRIAEDPAEVERITYSVFGMMNWIYGWYDPKEHGDAQQLARTMHHLVLCGALTSCPVREVHVEMDVHFEGLKPPPLLGGNGRAAEEGG